MKNTLFNRSCKKLIIYVDSWVLKKVLQKVNAKEDFVNIN